MVHADYYTEYVWYRAFPEEQRVVITVETLRGETAVDHYHAHHTDLESEGKYLTYDYKAGSEGKSRTLQFEERMAGHEIRTSITIQYPRGHGAGGALPSVHIQIYYDGVIRLDAPLGYNHRSSISIPRIDVHLDDGSGEMFVTTIPGTPTSTGSTAGITGLFFNTTDKCLRLVNGILSETDP